MRNVQLVALLGLVSAVACSDSIPTAPSPSFTLVSQSSTQIVHRRDVELVVLPENTCTGEQLTLTGNLLFTRKVSQDGTTTRTFFNFSNLRLVDANGTRYVAHAQEQQTVELTDGGFTQRTHTKLTLISRGPGEDMHIHVLFELGIDESGEPFFREIQTTVECRG